jgi:hypothetical protein
MQASYFVLLFSPLFYHLFLKAKSKNWRAGAGNKNPERDPFSWSEDREQELVRGAECQAMPVFWTLFFFSHPSEVSLLLWPWLLHTGTYNTWRKSTSPDSEINKQGTYCAKSVREILLTILFSLFFPPHITPKKAQWCWTAQQDQQI